MKNLYNLIIDISASELSTSPYFNLTTISELKSGAVSVVFNGIKPFDIKELKKGFVFSVRRDFLRHCSVDSLGLIYTTSELSSQPDFIRITVVDEFVVESFLKHFFSHCHEYFDIIYTPKERFVCCHRFTECSDALKCIHPDYLHSKGCSYRKNLEKGKVFYGKNRNIVD